MEDAERMVKLEMGLKPSFSAAIAGSEVKLELLFVSSDRNAPAIFCPPSSQAAVSQFFMAVADICLQRAEKLKFRLNLLERDAPFRVDKFLDQLIIPLGALVVKRVVAALSGKRLKARQKER